MKSNTSAVLILLFSIPAVHAQTGICNDPSSDSDGDGWGWEQGESCSIEPIEITALPECADASTDSDGDGFGWENDQSCSVSVEAEENTPERSFCAFSTSDPDEDGFGFENNRSCIMSERHFVDAPIGTTQGNPQPISMNELVTGTSDGSGRHYYSLKVPSTNPVTLSGSGRLDFLNFIQGENRWGGTGGLSPYTSSNVTAHFCLPPGTHLIEVVRPLHYSIKAEQTLTTPCVNPATEPDPNTPNSYAKRGMYRTSPFSITGIDEAGADDWAFFSNKRIRDFRKSDDGLIYVYGQGEYDGSMGYPYNVPLALYVLDPDNRATNEQLSLATASRQPSVCENSSTDPDKENISGQSL